MSNIERERELRSYVEDLNSRIINGDLLGAFDDYYAENVSMQDNNLEPMVGKAENRVREEEFLANLVEFRGAEVLSVGVDAEANKTLVEWIFDYSHKDWGDVRNHQVSIQEWDNDRIIRETFIYPN